MAKDNATLIVRVDPDDKKEAAEILDSLGLNLSTAVNMLLKQIILRKSIPFKVATEDASENLAKMLEDLTAELKK